MGYVNRSEVVNLLMKLWSLLKNSMQKGVIVFIGFCFMASMVQGQGNRDEEVGLRIREVSAQLSGKQYELALKSIFSLLEDSHKYDKSVGRVASLYLNQLAACYPQAESSARLYVKKKIDEALTGKLRIEHMDNLGKISELFKLEGLLRSSFDDVISAQTDPRKKKAWAKATFLSLYKSKRYNEILAHIDLVKEAEMYLSDVKKLLQAGGDDRNMVLMSKGLIIEDFNLYLAVYRSVDDKKNVENMNSLIIQLNQLGKE